MNPKNPSNEEYLEDLNLDDEFSSVDDFIKELEEKEKDLEISSDLIIEVGDSDVEHDNIHDSFIPNNSVGQINLGNSLSGQISPLQNQPNQNSEIESKLKKQVSDLISERDKLIETMNRRQKDFDNHRNRTERERKDTYKNVLGSLATQMLPVLDNLNRALDATANAETSNEKDFQNFLDGIVLVNQQLNEVLAGMGVQPIPALGKPFDPNIHEAVASEDNEQVPPRTVIQELLTGYRIDDKVIRASMVKVSSAKKNSNPSPKD